MPLPCPCSPDACVEPHKCQKRPTVGAKETYYMRTFESLPASGAAQGVEQWSAVVPHAKLCSKVQGLGFRVQFRVQDLGFRSSGVLQCPMPNSVVGFRVQGLGFSLCFCINCLEQWSAVMRCPVCLPNSIQTSQKSEKSEILESQCPSILFTDWSHHITPLLLNPKP